MMGRTTHTDSSPDIEIKVQPRRGDFSPPFAGVPPPPAARAPPVPNRRPPPPPPPHPAFQPFKSWFPWLVPTIAVLNVVLFVISMYLNNCPRSGTQKCIGEKELGRFSFQPTHENPLLGPSALTLLKMGALEAKKVIDDKEAWRLISCMWLHAGVFHILANMLSLLFVGIRLEQEFGYWRIGLLYVISGIGGSLLSSLFVRKTISVGASGALFGLLGGMLSELITNWTIYANKATALLTLLLIILVNLAVGILPHVDNYAHIGGFVTGFLLGFVLLMRPQFGWVNQRTAPPGYFAPPARSKYKIYQYVLLVLSAIVLVLGFLAGFVFLLKGVDGNQHCSWCHYLSCVPTPFWSCETRCRSTQIGNRLNLTCLQNGKSQSFPVASNVTSNLQQLCLDLCT